MHEVTEKSRYYGLGKQAVNNKVKWGTNVNSPVLRCSGNNYSVLDHLVVPYGGAQ